MPKKSKRQRKLEKERELNKATVTRNTYKNHKKRVCEHFSWNIEGGFFNTYLTKNEDGTYKCSGCGKVFNVEQAERIESLCKYLTAPGTKTTEAVAKLFTPDIMPNEYYYVAPDKTELCATIERDPELLIRHYENDRMKTKAETLGRLELLIKKAQNETLCVKDAKEIFGRPRTIYFEFPLYIWCSYDHFPYYQTEELIELIKYSENTNDAYEKIGRMLSLSNLTPGIKERSREFRITCLEEQHDEEREFSSTLMPRFENVFFREDCFEYLLQKGIDHQSAYALMKQVSREVYSPHHAIFHKRFSTRFEKLDNRFYEWAEKVRYLPSRKLIFDIFDEPTT